MTVIVKKQVPQGDLLVTRIDALPDQKELEMQQPQNEGYIVAHSETGHHHVLERNPNVTYFKKKSDPLEAFVQVKDGSVEIRHTRQTHTHETLELPTGIYRLRNQREKDHLEEAVRIARD